MKWYLSNIKHIYQEAWYICGYSGFYFCSQIFSLLFYTRYIVLVRYVLYSKGFFLFVFLATSSMKFHLITFSVWLLLCIKMFYSWCVVLCPSILMHSIWQLILLNFLHRQSYHRHISSMPFYFQYKMYSFFPVFLFGHISKTMTNACTSLGVIILLLLELESFYYFNIRCNICHRCLRIKLYQANFFVFKILNEYYIL